MLNGVCLVQFLLALDTDRKYRNVNNSSRPKDTTNLLTDAIRLTQLCIGAQVNSNVKAMGPYELVQFATFMRVNIHVYVITNEDSE